MTTHHYRRWSGADDARLTKLWSSSDSLREIAHVLGRTELTTYWRARHLGLECGCPEGYESITTSAERTGFDRATLLRVLTAAKVRPLEWRARPRTATGRNRFRFVDPFDVDQAIEAWGQSEIVAVGARRHGIAQETLKAWLVDAGHKPPRGRKRTWRVPSAVIDFVVADRRALASVAEHARRVGLCRSTLAKRLRAAGVLGEKRPGVTANLTREVVDAALGRARANSSKTSNGSQTTTNSPESPDGSTCDTTRTR